jgi:BMFP domain-containing protein YqiC
MKQLLKVTDHPNMFRDPHTKAIIVMDSVARTNYNNQRELAKKAQESNNELREEVNHLKSELGEIKSLLQKLVG